MKDIVNPIFGLQSYSINEIPDWESIVRNYPKRDFLYNNAKFVNDSTNHKFKYVIKQDKTWLSPNSLLRTGEGECIDFAIFKYFSLELPKYLVIGGIKETNEPHAVCVVYTSAYPDDWVVLDNRYDEIITYQEFLKTFTVLYVLDNDGVYR